MEWKKEKIKFSERNLNEENVKKFVTSKLNGSYISGSDIEREAQPSNEGFDYLCFIQYTPRYLGNIRRYNNKIKDISEIRSKIKQSNKRDLKKLDIYLFYNSSPPTLTLNKTLDNTKFIYNRFISGTITGDPDLENKFRVYIKINNESPVSAIVNSDGTWSGQLKSLKSNTKIERLQVFGYPQNHKTDTSNIAEYTNIIFSDNPQIVITTGEVVPKCRDNRKVTSNDKALAYRIDFKGSGLDDNKLQLKLNFEPNLYANRDNAERLNLKKELTWIVPRRTPPSSPGESKKEYKIENPETGETYYCFFIDLNLDLINKFMAIRDDSKKNEVINDCNFDFHISGVFQYEIEDGNFKDLGTPRNFSFTTFSQVDDYLNDCDCNSR